MKERQREKVAIFRIFYDTSEADWEKGFTSFVNINFARSWSLFIAKNIRKSSWISFAIETINVNWNDWCGKRTWWKIGFHRRFAYVLQI